MIETMKLLVADIDGTLVNEPREMMPLTRAVLNDLHTRGVLLGIASGRPLGPHLYEQKDEWKVNFNFDMWIGMNGGQLYDVHKDTYEHFYKLQPKTIEEIITFMKPMHANPFIYLGEDMLSEEVDEEMFESMKRHHIQCTKAEELSELWKGPTSKILFRLSDASQMPEAESFAAQHPSKIMQLSRHSLPCLNFRIHESIRDLELKDTVSRMASLWMKSWLSAICPMTMA